MLLRGREIRILGCSLNLFNFGRFKGLCFPTQFLCVKAASHLFNTKKIQSEFLRKRRSAYVKLGNLQTLKNKISR
jgi:hypothetical protein